LEQVVSNVLNPVYPGQCAICRSCLSHTFRLEFFGHPEELERGAVR
jgi:hypothetical protein